MLGAIYRQSIRASSGLRQTLQVEASGHDLFFASISDALLAQPPGDAVNVRR